MTVGLLPAATGITTAPTWAGRVRQEGQTSSVRPSSTSPEGLLDAADHCSHGIEAALCSLQFLAQLRHAAPEVAPKVRARLATGGELLGQSLQRLRVLQADRR